MQVDGEPWRQPIPAAANVQQRQRPAGLQESGPSTTGGAAGGSGGDGSAAQQAVQQVVVHVAHAGQSEVLFNEADPQGIRRVRNLASRGAQRSSKVPSKFSFLKAAAVGRRAGGLRSCDAALPAWGCRRALESVDSSIPVGMLSGNS